MTRVEFLERVNERAAELGLKPVRDRHIRDWVEKGLVPGPERHGGARYPDWRWTEAALQAAFEVLDLHHRGFSRTRQIRAQLWLETDRIEFESVIADIAEEYARAMRSLRRPIRSAVIDINNTSNHSLSALKKQIGQVDHRLSALGITAGEEAATYALPFAIVGSANTEAPPWWKTAANILTISGVSFDMSQLVGTLPEEKAELVTETERRLSSLSRNQRHLLRGLYRSAADFVQFGIALHVLQHPDRHEEIEGLATAIRETLRRPPWGVGLFGMAATIVLISQENETA